MSDRKQRFLNLQTCEQFSAPSGTAGAAGVRGDRLFWGDINSVASCGNQSALCPDHLQYDLSLKLNTINPILSLGWRPAALL